MCVIYLAFNQHHDYPLILLANRDEFYDRPSQAAGFWEDRPHIYGGRDLVGGGTWLGVTNGGRFAAVTNYRDPTAAIGRLSRGGLVADFLNSDSRAKDYLEQVKTASNEYSGFNLLAGEISGDRRELYYYSNRGTDVQELMPGIYGLSNHLLDTPWPKVAKGKGRFTNLLNSSKLPLEGFFKILADESLAKDKDLPSTGVPYETEKAISAVFIKTSGYGTRCSTVLTFDSNFDWKFEERVFV
jgi:uncharacterized protein with NRDE domain